MSCSQTRQTQNRDSSANKLKISISNLTTILSSDEVRTERQVIKCLFIYVHDAQRKTNSYTKIHFVN